MLELPGLVDAFVGSPTVLHTDGQTPPDERAVREVLERFKVEVESLREDPTQLL